MVKNGRDLSLPVRNTNLVEPDSIKSDRGGVIVYYKLKLVSLLLMN